MPSAVALAKTRAVVRCVMFAAIIAGLGLFPPIAVPVVAVPITAQTLGVMLAGAILGARNGALSVFIFLCAVGIGFPLLAGGRGGLGMFFAPSAGYLLGWIPGAYFTGFMTRSSNANLPKLVTACLIGGVGVIYFIGIPWMAAVTDLSLLQAAIASVIFVPGDVIKAVLAAGIARAVHRGMPAVLQ